MKRAKKANLRSGRRAIAATGVVGVALFAAGWVWLAPPTAEIHPPAPPVEAESFMRAAGARTFREAELKAYEGRSFNARELRYEGEALYAPFEKSPPGMFPRAGGEGTGHWWRPEAEAELDRLTGYDLTRNDDVTLWNDGQAAWPLRQVVEHAREFLFLNFLAVTCDSGTEGLISAIEAKARAGVDVRVLVGRSYAFLSGSCLDRLQRAGVNVLRAATHASYAVNDQDELVIGSESLASTFVNATGTDALDRDVMLWARGPLATDALGDFLALWDESRVPLLGKGFEKLVARYKEQLAREVAAGRRGSLHYRAWLGAREGGRFCRFNGQRPGRAARVNDLLDWLAGHAARRIVFSGVRLGPIAAVRTAVERAEHAGIALDFVGNGFNGGDGEATMAMNDAIAALDQAGWPRIAEAARIARDGDMRRMARERAESYRILDSPGEARVWLSQGFVHHKIWLFDRDAVWVGSANPDLDSLREAEAGVFCVDAAIAAKVEERLGREIANSAPLRRGI